MTQAEEYIVHKLEEGWTLERQGDHLYLVSNAEHTFRMRLDCHTVWGLRDAGILTERYVLTQEAAL